MNDDSIIGYLRERIEKRFIWHLRERIGKRFEIIFVLICK